MRSCSGFSLRARISKISSIDGPPSLSYLCVGDRPVAWQKSSCGNRAIQTPGAGTNGVRFTTVSSTPIQRRSKRLTMRAFCSPNMAISVSAVGSPNSFMSRAQSHSFSTESEKSPRKFPITPSGNLRMWVVGVAFFGRYQIPPIDKRAVFSCAPAIEIRKSSSASSVRGPRGGGALTARSACSTSVVERGSASMWFHPTGSRLRGKSCTAPTQSRPMASRRSNVPDDRSANRSRIRLRMSGLSGSKLSK